jgi:integrase
MSQQRIKTNYPGVFYRIRRRIGGPGSERVYFVVYKKDGEPFEEKAGRQYADDMTPARAATIRGELIEGKRLSRKELREKEAAEKAAEAGKWTIERLWKEYRKSRPGLKGIKTDKSRFEKHLKTPFGNKQPSEILPLDIKRVENKLLKTKKPATVRNVLELLRRVVNFGVNSRLCPGFDFRIQLPEVHNERTEDLSPGELQSLLKAIEADKHPQAGALMKMALYTGLRRGEMFKLKWSDIDFDRGFILIRDPKGGMPQTVPLNDMVRELLRVHKKNSEFVFPGRGGRQRTDINKAVNEIKTAAGLPPGFRPLHGLRHVYASMLASSGEVDLYTLQRLLTHKSPAMTQRYAHLRDDSLKRAANLAGDIISQAAKTKDESEQAG